MLLTCTNRYTPLIVVHVCYYVYLTLDLQPGPAVLAFRLLYAKLLYVLQSWVLSVTSSCHTKGLIPDDTNLIIKCTPAMPSNEKVALMLDAVQASIHENHRSLHRFVRVLKRKGATLELIGAQLQTTYREHTYNNIIGVLNV